MPIPLTKSVHRRVLHRIMLIQSHGPVQQFVLLLPACLLKIRLESAQQTAQQATLIQRYKYAYLCALQITTLIQTLRGV
jgi:hypothetical protein